MVARWLLTGLARTEDGADGIGVHVRPEGAGARLAFDGEETTVSGRLGKDDSLEAQVDGRRHRARIAWDGTDIHLELEGVQHRLRLHDPLAAAAGQAAGGNRLIAPMPSKVVQVHVRPGQRVARGDALMVLEAMKMEHTIVAPLDGRVAAVHYRAGALVEEGVELADIEKDD